MPLQFTPSDQLQAQQQNETATTVSLAKEAEVDNLNIQVADSQSYSMIDTREQLKSELVSADEVNKLVSTININDTNSIVKVGADVAEEISKASDQVLRCVLGII